MPMDPVFHTGDGVAQTYVRIHQLSESLRRQLKSKQMQFPLLDV